MVGLAAWLSRAQDDYIRAYANVTGLPAPTSRPLLLMVLRPWGFLWSRPTNVSRAMNTRQDDARLEALRQRYWSRQRLVYVAAGAAFIAVLIIRFH
jgi:hypothetical protein